MFVGHLYGIFGNFGGVSLILETEVECSESENKVRFMPNRGRGKWAGTSDTDIVRELSLG